MISKIQQKLTKEEKDRADFREWLNGDVKAEFINGEVVMHSPAKRGHLNTTGNLFKLLDTYVDIHKLGAVSTEKALIGLERNDYEPDIAFWNNEKAAKFDDDTMVHPPTDLIVEVLSDSTKGRDRGIKFKDYAAHGIHEYWIIDSKKQTVEQYVLDNENAQEYSLLSKVGIGQHLDCQIVKGFSIPVKAIFEKDINLQTLEDFFAKKQPN